tara:strand:- start:340 stop:927 length:588 start_codon:yes stop_codon:yes gene_type:complete
MNKLSAATILLTIAQNTLNPGSTGTKIDNTDIAKKIVEGAEVARDREYYIRKNVAASSGSIEVLNSATQKAQGVTNFVNGALDSGRVLVVTKMRIAHFAAAALADAIFTNTMSDPGVKNGEIKIMQGNKTLYNGPVSKFANSAAGEAPAFGYVDLDTPFVVQPQEALTISVFFAKATAANQNIEIVLSGVENQAR